MKIMDNDRLGLSCTVHASWLTPQPGKYHQHADLQRCPGGVPGSMKMNQNKMYKVLEV